MFVWEGFILNPNKQTKCRLVNMTPSTLVYLVTIKQYQDIAIGKQIYYSKSIALYFTVFSHNMFIKKTFNKKNLYGVILYL